MKPLRRIGSNGGVRGSVLVVLPAVVLLLALSAVTPSLHSSAASVRLGGPEGETRPAVVHTVPAERVRVIVPSGSDSANSTVARREKNDEETTGGAFPPLPEKLPGKGAPLRRLLSPLASNLILTAVIFPDAFSPMVLSGVQIFNLMYRPHEMGWAPELKWDVQACQLVTSFGKGYEQGKLLKVSSKTFAVHASQATGRVYVRWSDRNDPATLWLKPRMESTNILATSFCHFDQQRSFVYGVEGDMGLLMAITMFRKLPRNSYLQVPTLAEKDFLPKYTSQFHSQADIDSFIGSPCPSNDLGWDSERCHAHHVFEGAAGSRAVQYSTMSMRGLLRVIIPAEKKVALVAQVHPGCTYKAGQKLTVGEVDLRNGLRKLIIMMDALSQHNSLFPDDLVEIPIQKIDKLSDLDKEMGSGSQA